MKDDEDALQEKRVELKHLITEGMGKTFPAYLFNAVGNGLARILRLKIRPHWAISAIVLLVLLLLPGLLIALLGEPKREVIRSRSSGKNTLDKGVLPIVFGCSNTQIAECFWLRNAGVWRSTSIFELGASGNGANPH